MTDNTTVTFLIALHLLKDPVTPVMILIFWNYINSKCLNKVTYIKRINNHEEDCIVILLRTRVNKTDITVVNHVMNHVISIVMFISLKFGLIFRNIIMKNVEDLCLVECGREVLC